LHSRSLQVSQRRHSAAEAVSLLFETMQLLRLIPDIEECSWVYENGRLWTAILLLVKDAVHGVTQWLAERVALGS
jgi:hypothetical protein